MGAAAIALSASPGSISSNLYPAFSRIVLRCGEADAYEADNFEVEGDHYVAIITGHRAVSAIPLGSRIPVPRQKMKYEAGNPTGHGIIFIDVQRRVLCYVTPAAG